MTDTYTTDDKVAISLFPSLFKSHPILVLVVSAAYATGEVAGMVIAVPMPGEETVSIFAR